MDSSKKDFAGNLRAVVNGEMDRNDFVDSLSLFQEKSLLEKSPIPGRAWNFFSMSRYLMSQILDDVKTNEKNYDKDFDSIFRFPDRMDRAQLVSVAEALIQKYRAEPAQIPRGEGGAAQDDDAAEDRKGVLEAAKEKKRTADRVAQLELKLAIAKMDAEEAAKAFDELNRKRMRK